MSPAYSIKKHRHEKPCELCKRNGILAQRLNPTNWHPEHRRLCTTHQKQLGFHPVDFGHTTGRTNDT